MADFHEVASDDVEKLYLEALARLKKIEAFMKQIGAHDLAHKVRTAIKHLEVVAKEAYLLSSERVQLER